MYSILILERNLRNFIEIWFLTCSKDESEQKRISILNLSNNQMLSLFWRNSCPSSSFNPYLKKNLQLSDMISHPKFRRQQSCDTVLCQRIVNILRSQMFHFKLKSRSFITRCFFLRFMVSFSNWCHSKLQKTHKNN